MTPRFIINIIHYEWTCGDGCCSDSGYKTSVIDTTTSNTIFFQDEWEHNHDKDYAELACLDALTEVLGRQTNNNDYTFHYTIETSDGEKYEDYN